MIKSIRGQYKGRLGGLDKVVKIRDRHHRIRRQILRQKCRSYFDSSSKLKIFIFRPQRPLKALKDPQIKFSQGLMHRPYRDLQNLKLSHLYLLPFSHKVVPQVWGVGEGRGGGGRIQHFMWSIYYRGGNFFSNPG